jgi:hypothetical protein
MTTAADAMKSDQCYRFYPNISQGFNQSVQWCSWSGPRVHLHMHNSLNTSYKFCPGGGLVPAVPRVPTTSVRGGGGYLAVSYFPHCFPQVYSPIYIPRSPQARPGGGGDTLQCVICPKSGCLSLRHHSACAMLSLSGLWIVTVRASSYHKQYIVCLVAIVPVRVCASSCSVSKHHCWSGIVSLIKGERDWTLYSQLEE